MLLFGVSLACYSPSPRSVQDQAYSAAVVLEGKVQALPAAPPTATAGNDSREEAPPPPGILVKVLDLWPLNSGGLQREQLIRVGSTPAPCFKVKRNHRYIFFLEPTEQPLVFKTSFAPLDTSGKNLKKDVARILCADCGERASERAAAPLGGGAGRHEEAARAGVGWGTRRRRALTSRPDPRPEQSLSASNVPSRFSAVLHWEAG